MTATTIDGVAATPRLRRAAPWGTALRLAVLAGAVALLVRLGVSSWDDIRDATTALLSGQLHLLLAAVVLQVAWAFSLAQISRTALRAVGGDVGRLQAVRISMAGFTLSRVVPTGGVAGGVFAAHEFIRLGNKAPVAFAGMAVSWAVSITTLAVMVTATAVVASAAGELPAAALIPSSAALITVVAMIAAVAWTARRWRRRRRGLDRIDRGLRRLHINASSASWQEALDGVAAHLREWRRLLPVLGWSVVSWSLDATSLWLLFLGFGHTLAIGDIALGYGFANLLSALPEITPGWIGVYEAAVAATYIGLGIPSGIAVAAVLSYRVISFWLPVTAGIFPLLRSLAGRNAALATVNGKESSR